MTDRVVIVGGGIAGLAAAHELRIQGRDFVLLEESGRVGGKIAGGPVADSGLPFDVDMAADGFLLREPEMAELCVELGLQDDLVAPVGGGAFLWVDGALRRIPPSVLGAPLDPESVAASGIVSPAGVTELAERSTADLPALEGDAAVGAVLRPRVGDEVFARMVDPLLGGINAGNADHMSIRAGAAALAGAASIGGPFVEALRDHVAAATGAPVFNAIRGGSQRIIDALTDELGDHVRTGAAVFDLERNGAKWIVRTDEEAITADRVILTTPAWVSAGLLAPHAPEAAAVLAGITYADAVLVTFVVKKDAIDHPLDGAGFLVPRDQGLLMTACSWSSSKWGHYDDGTHAVLRVSAGRTDDLRWLDLEPDALVDRLRGELATTIGLHGHTVARLSPWRKSLPQYRPGHLDRCDRIDEWLGRDAPGIRVAGASMRGLGLPACVRQGRTAADPGR
jgi:protoporphyrinogen/coproporphyrinogen III oxidase